MLAMLDAIARMDQTAFTQGALAALDAFRRLAMRGDRRDLVSSLFDLELVGIAALGVDSGLAWELDTPYVPTRLVEGDVS